MLRLQVQRLTMIDGFFSIFNWRLVRAYGALTVLTRASYLMLVLVPLLAGMWPAVRMTIDKARDKLEHVADRVNSDAKRVLERSVEFEARQKIAEGSEGEDWRPEQPSEVALKLVKESEKLSKNLKRLAASLPESMPAVWAYAFFAALAVALGQLFYQTSAPEIVRKYTLEEYQNSQATPHGREPTSDEVNKALEMIRAAEARDGTLLNRKLRDCVSAILSCARIFHQRTIDIGNRRHRDSPPRAPLREELAEISKQDDIQQAIGFARSDLRQAGKFYAIEILELMQNREVVESLIPKLGWIGGRDPGFGVEFEVVEYVASQQLSPPFKFQNDAERIAHNRERVWIGARIEYLDQSSALARGRCFTALSFHLIASILIAWITYTQARSVADAVGWIKIH